MFDAVIKIMILPLRELGKTKCIMEELINSRDMIIPSCQGSMEIWASWATGFALRLFHSSSKLSIKYGLYTEF